MAMKSPKKLSIVMPFLNEGNEPILTIQSIYDTANPDDFEIVAIQDSPEPHVLEEVNKPNSLFPSVRFYKNKSRCGVDATRNAGVHLASSPNILLIDAHMRFKKNSHWLPRIVEVLEKEPQTLFCTTCLGLGYERGDNVETADIKYYGATLLMTNDFKEKQSFFCGNGEKKVAREVLEPKWLRGLKENTPSPYEVPCVMGANYCFTKKWFEYLHGLNFLLSWGSSEPYLALKSWLAGGNVKLLYDVEIGHIFRDRAPYTTPVWHLIFNKLLMARLLLPADMDFIIESYLPQGAELEDAKKIYSINADKLEAEHKYLQSIFQRTAKDYCKYHQIYFPDKVMT